jgi:hypothetical protein
LTHFGLNDWSSIPGKEKKFYVIYSVQTVCGSHPAFYQKGTGGSFFSNKGLRREADNSPTSSAEIDNAWSYTFTPSYVFMTWRLKDIFSI